MNTKYKVCLSVAQMDAEFEKMAHELGKYAQVEVVGLDGYSLEGADIFIGKKLSEEVLDTADRLKVVFAYKTGVDDFPLQAFKRRGITLVNSHVDADYIAEYAVGLSIDLLCRITESDKKLRHGIWRDKDKSYWTSIFDVKYGLLGYGKIGQKVHEFLSRNHIPTYTIDRGKDYGDINLVSSLEELCRETDMIIISLPKTAETDKLFNREIFELLQDKYIVNVGRSNCIDQEALYNALKEDRLAGAAIDTWDSKPRNMYDSRKLPSYEYPFQELDNIVLSPHKAMHVEDGHRRYVQDTSEKVIAYIENGALRDVVNLDKGY